MAVKLNLLPENYSLRGPMGQIINFIRPLNVILLGIFLIMALGMGAYFVFSSLSLNSLNTENTNLESQIKTLSSAQQQIVLLKDRLVKIKTVQTIPEASKNLASLDPTLASLGSSSLILELDVDSAKTNSSLAFKSNSDMTNFLKSLSTNTAFTSVTMSALNYSPSDGYQMTLSFLNKK